MIQQAETTESATMTESMMETKPVSVPLTQLTRGQRATVSTSDLDEQDAQMLRAMGLRPDASIQMCRLGEPCIVTLSGECGGGCRIGLAKDIASRVLVTPHN